MSALKKTLKDMADVVRGAIEEVGVDDLERIRTSVPAGRDAIVIDVREPEEYAEGRIPGAIHIPRGVLERDLEERAFKGEVTHEDLQRPVIVYCGGGSRSLLAAATLKEMGFTNAKSLAGGMRGYKAAGGPLAR